MLCKISLCLQHTAFGNVCFEGAVCVCVCVFCVLVIHYEGAGENRLMKAARSSRLESPLPACVSHQLLTSRADSPLGGSGSAEKRLLLRDHALCSVQPLNKQGGRGGRHPRLGLGSCREGCNLVCTGRAGPRGHAQQDSPPPQTPCAARGKLGSAQTQSERPFPSLSQLTAVAETALAITRINSVCLSGR